MGHTTNSVNIKRTNLNLIKLLSDETLVLTDSMMSDDSSLMSHVNVLEKKT